MRAPAAASLQMQAKVTNAIFAASCLYSCARFATLATTTQSPTGFCAMLTIGRQLASPLVARRQRDAPICVDRRLVRDEVHAVTTRSHGFYLLCFSVGFASLPWFVAMRRDKRPPPSTIFRSFNVLNTEFHPLYAQSTCASLSAFNNCATKRLLNAQNSSVYR